MIIEVGCCYRGLTRQKVGGQAVLGRQSAYATPWLTERHGYDPTWLSFFGVALKIILQMLCSLVFLLEEI